MFLKSEDLNGSTTYFKGVEKMLQKFWRSHNKFLCYNHLMATKKKMLCMKLIGGVNKGEI